MTRKPLIAALAAALAASSLLVPAAEARTLFEVRSLYRNIVIDETGNERCMLFRARRGLGRETCMYVNNPDRFVFEYAGMMISSLYMKAEAPKRILIIGQGGGTLPTALRKIVPTARIDVVELDKAVDTAARRYFGFKPDSQMVVTIQDGRNFVKRAIQRKQTWDLVMLDAFADDYIPEHMSSKEYLEEVKKIISPGGVLAANTWSSVGLYPYESVTYAAAFGPFYNLKRDNRIILTRLGGLPTQAELATNARRWETAFARHGVSSSTLLPMFSTARDWDPNTRVLTDQFSPANVLNAL